jgi:hypothetical protein
MSLTDVFREDDETDGAIALATRGLQAALAVLIAYGGITGEFDLLINGIPALGLTFFPALLARRYDHETDPHVALWITVAALLHVVGFLGPYSVQSGPLSFYDQVAHAISASFVAGVGYALIEALDRTSTRIRFPDGFRFLFTLLFILAFGVAWEILEFGAGTGASMLGAKEVLVQYGIDDIVNDLVFNTLAAGVVALWGTGYFDGIASLFSRRVLGSENS